MFLLLFSFLNFSEYIKKKRGRAIVTCSLITRMTFLVNHIMSNLHANAFQTQTSSNRNAEFFNRETIHRCTHEHTLHNALF